MIPTHELPSPLIAWPAERKLLCPMTTLPSIFDTCRPRADVEAGTTRDEQFAADLAQVIRGTAPREYSDPLTFFRHSYPTRGMKALLQAVCKRVSGAGGEVASIVRLQTPYGGGKTHLLIALIHAMRGMPGVENVGEFVDPALLPKGRVRLAALDGENSDPADGLTLEGDLRAFSLWGELAYRLAGREGYERVRQGDRNHVAPGAETIRELFGGEPTLILLDEVSVYLRKVEQVRPGASAQFTAFLQAIMKAVESSPNAALVLTLAVGKADEARDAYREEHERALSSLAEAESVASRKATQLNPTEEDETAAVLRRRLFDSVDMGAADAVVAEYVKTWTANRDALPPSAFTPEVRELFRRGYPLHPETLSVLTEKTASLSTFQRTRGMLRLLARTVHLLWKNRPADAFAVHPHHIDPGFGPIREEITTRLGQGEYTPALKADVAAVVGDKPATAQLLDLKFYPNQLPITSYIARTIFLHTLAHGDSAKGIIPERLKFALCSPSVEPSFIEQARLRFLQESDYLDDRPGAPMRFRVEPNLTQLIRKQKDEIDPAEVRSDLNERIRHLFGAPGGVFNLVPFPAGPYEVPDEVGDGRPFLVVMGYEALAIPIEPRGLPEEIEAISKYKGADNRFRDFRNNLVFVVADERLRENMKDRVRTRLALFELQKADRIGQLAEHQQQKIKEDYLKSKLEIALAVMQCYRHLFYPSHLPMAGTTEPIGHTALEAHNVSDDPGNGQVHVVRKLREHNKLIDEGDKPNAPAYVRDQTPLRIKGELSTLDLRNEFRRAAKLSILLSDSPLIQCVRDGIEADVLIYREGNQVWGKGDPLPPVCISDNAFLHTLDNARKRGLWPRPAPLAVHLSASPSTIHPGERSTLTVTVSGGVGPYVYRSTEKALCLEATTQTALRVDVVPAGPMRYEVDVSDSRGEKRSAAVSIAVGTEPGKIVVPPLVPPPPPPTGPRPVEAQGPLAQALTELWEKARKEKFERIKKLIVKFFEPAAAFKVHSAIATVRDALLTVRFEAAMGGDGVETFRVEFAGRIDKANAIKSFLDPQLRTATESNFEAEYGIEFTTGLPLNGPEPAKLANDLTRYGAGEAYVEAHAAPAGGPS
ncbi:MAG: ATP-binding protein [Gemmataceae bacterium]